MTKILIVDDEPDLELLIKQKFAKHLKSKELEFVFASNGFEALKTLHKDLDINIILTDINMPEMDGLALLSHLPELNRIMKAIIVSAYGDMSNIRKAMNRGACDFITKPIDFKDLEITIFNAIEQYLTQKKSIEAQSTLSHLEKELSIARSIQESIIPHQFTPIPEIHSFEILGTTVPAQQVGGDFFDFFKLADNRLGFLIGDVSGKGIPAALFMTMTRAVMRTVAQRYNSPQDCLKEANRILCMDNDTSMFVTLLYGILNPATGEIQLSNAGHNPPYLLAADRTLSEIARNEGVPLGVDENTPFMEHRIRLNKSDCLILYTDGITEATNLQNEQYGRPRLEETIRNWPKDDSLASLLNHILEDVHQFTGGVLLYDDMALFCLKQLV